MANIVCPGLLGAIRNPWPEQSRWLIALLFMHTILNAQSTGKMLFHSQVGSMEDGSHLICLVHLKVNPTAATGNKEYSSLVIKHCPGPALQPRAQGQECFVCKLKHGCHWPKAGNMSCIFPCAWQQCPHECENCRAAEHAAVGCPDMKTFKQVLLAIAVGAAGITE